jgi:hypothetical protein
VELSLGRRSARLVHPEDMTSFAVVLDGEHEPGAEAIADGVAHTRGRVDDELGAVRAQVERR